MPSAAWHGDSHVMAGIGRLSLLGAAHTKQGLCLVYNKLPKGLAKHVNCRVLGAPGAGSTPGVLEGSCCCAPQGAGILTATELSWHVLAMYSALSSKLRCCTGAVWGVKQLTCGEGGGTIVNKQPWYGDRGHIHTGAWSQLQVTQELLGCDPATRSMPF